MYSCIQSASEGMATVVLSLPRTVSSKGINCLFSSWIISVSSKNMNCLFSSSSVSENVSFFPRVKGEIVLALYKRLIRLLFPPRIETKELSTSLFLIGNKQSCLFTSRDTIHLTSLFLLLLLLLLLLFLISSGISPSS